MATAFSIAFLVALSLPFSPILAIDLLRSPKIVTRTLDSSVVFLCYETLEEAQLSCLTEYIFYDSCTNFCCHDKNKPAPAGESQAIFPILQSCSAFGRPDIVFANERRGTTTTQPVYTYLRRNPSVVDDGEFLACVTPDLVNVAMDRVLDITDDDTEVYAYTRERGAVSLSVPRRFSIDKTKIPDGRIRLRDLSGACFNQWYPNSMRDGPMGATITTNAASASATGAAIYCKPNCEDVGLSISASGSNWWYDDGTVASSFRVDSFYQRSICTSSGVIGALPTLREVSGGLEGCDQECATIGRELAVLSPNYCYCASFADFFVSVALQAPENCQVCNDNIPGSSLESRQHCGGLDTVSIYLTEAFERPPNYGYEYWQCVRNFRDIWNPPNQVLPNSFHSEIILPDGHPSQCFQRCDGLKTDLAVIEKDDDISPNQYICHCLPAAPIYRFHTRDLDYPCLNAWCPSIEGPCVSLNGPSAISNAAVVYERFSLSNDPTDILLPPDTTGICEPEGEGFLIRPAYVDERYKFNVYLECVYNPMNLVWSWDLRSCPPEQVFVDSVGCQPCPEGEEFLDGVGCITCTPTEEFLDGVGCITCTPAEEFRQGVGCIPVEGRNCTAYDSRGVFWWAAEGVTALKDCNEGLTEESTTLNGKHFFSNLFLL